MAWTVEDMKRRTDQAVALLDRATEERRPDAFRRVRLIELLRDHLELADQDEVWGTVAELRRRGG